MSLLPIRVYPDPVLRRRCPPVERVDEELRRLAREMVETMYAAPGIGLAAPQVGVARRLAVVDVTVGEEEGTLLHLVNPEILEESGSDLDVEGCLSLPGVSGKVERPERIRVAFQDLEGERQEVDAAGLTARAICHEIDHLDGILFPDRMTGLRKERVRRQLKRIRREADAGWAAMETPV